MAQHTPEPWRVYDDTKHIVDTDGLRVAEVAWSLHPDGNAQAEANARRIVAAVNALVGVPTDYLERLKPGALADVIEGLID